ncbi:MAG: carboxypeptidase-like regulatory domain-containing protein [Pirellula sp.]|nr:carboxypeptidase-like regulatory domain-containing protein [Pirellula sp.]
MQRTQRFTFSLCLSFALLAATFTGCESGMTLYDIPGSISIDGAAPEGATVMFHPTNDKLGYVATANVGSDGKFKILCNAKPGIPEGSYKVTVTWPDPSKKPTQQQMMTGLVDDAPDLLKGAYAGKASTPLTMDVTPSMKELPPIEIKTK